MDSKEWNSTAKKYIKECGKEINLNKTFKEYTNIVNAFYMWLCNLLFEHHKEDFTEKDKMAKELGISVEDLKVKLSDLIV